MNELITKRIREARKERGLTQQDLANHLGRTAAAISDLERGKVQVGAVDLYHISKLLNKPIEYFYGEDFGRKDIEDLIATIRKQSPEQIANTVETTNMLLQMQEIGDSIEGMKEEPSIEKIREFYNIFIPFSTIINNLTQQLNELRENLDKELKIQGIDINPMKTNIDNETNPLSINR